MSNTTRIDTYFALACMTFTSLADAEDANADRLGPCSVLVEDITAGKIVMEELDPLPGQDYPHGHCMQSLEALYVAVHTDRLRRKTDR